MEIVDTPTTTPSPTAPAVGTVLVTLPTAGRVNVISNSAGQGFSVVQSLRGQREQSVVQVYDIAGRPMATIPAGSFVGECGAADVTNGKGRLILTLQIIDTPAAGLKPATRELTLTAWRADTGAKVWTSSITGGPITLDEWGPYTFCTAYDGNLYNFTRTQDGKWGTLLFFGPRAINLETGELFDRDDVIGTIGNYVVIGEDPPATPWALLTVPGNWENLGDFAAANGGVPGVYSAIGYYPLETGTGVVEGRGTTPDGATLVLIRDKAVRAFTLPGLTMQWSVPAPDGYDQELAAVSAEYVVVMRVPRSSSNAQHELVALNRANGSVAWSVTLPRIVTYRGEHAVCGLTSSQLLLIADTQLVVLDVRTGDQLSYRDNPYEYCPQGVGSPALGLFVVDESVVQLLAP